MLPLIYPYQSSSQHVCTDPGVLAKHAIRIPVHSNIPALSPSSSPGIFDDPVPGRVVADHHHGMVHPLIVVTRQHSPRIKRPTLSINSHGHRSTSHRLPDSLASIVLANRADLITPRAVYTILLDLSVRVDIFGDQSVILDVVHAVEPVAAVATLVVVVGRAVDYLLFGEVGEVECVGYHVHGLDHGDCGEGVTGCATALVFDGGYGAAYFAPVPGKTAPSVGGGSEGATSG